MYFVYRPDPKQNRWYVIDLKGNKLYYGTKAQCRKFIKYMKGDQKHGTLGVG